MANSFYDTKFYKFFGDTPEQRELNFPSAVAAFGLILAGIVEIVYRSI